MSSAELQELEFALADEGLDLIPVVKETYEVVPRGSTTGRVLRADIRIGRIDDGGYSVTNVQIDRNKGRSFAIVRWVRSIDRWLVLTVHEWAEVLNALPAGPRNWVVQRRYSDHIDASTERTKPFLYDAQGAASKMAKILGDVRTTCPDLDGFSTMLRK